MRMGEDSLNDTNVHPTILSHFHIISITIYLLNMYDIQYNTGLYIQDTDINVDILQDSITVYREL